MKAVIYDSNGVLLDSFIANLGGEGENAIATFTRSTADIAYIWRAEFRAKACR